MYIKAFVVLLAFLIALPAQSHFPSARFTQPISEVAFGPMLLYPRGVMSADFDKMSVWDVGYARQLHRTPIYLGFHVGMGTYGGYWTETPYVYRGQWIDADLLLNDNVRTVFSTARLDFRRNAQLVPYTQLRFGYYSMFTTYKIGRAHV